MLQLLSQLVGPACVQARSSNREAGRVGLVGRDRGGGDIEWHCTCLFILPGL